MESNGSIGRSPLAGDEGAFVEAKTRLKGFELARHASIWAEPTRLARRDRRAVIGCDAS
jgi:hypothetical protein